MRLWKQNPDGDRVVSRKPEFEVDIRWDHNNFGKRNDVHDELFRYVGNRSPDAGSSFENFERSLPEAIIAVTIRVISASNSCVSSCSIQVLISRSNSG